MNILVVGCNGQLGTDCMAVLKKGATVGVDFPEVDIADRFQTLGKLDQLCPEIIVNCAAYTAVNACERDPACWTVNADGPKHLAEWAAKKNSFLVHVSTDYVFSGDRAVPEPWFETDTPAPIAEYGRSKLAGEDALLHSGASVAILRTAGLYGAHGKNFLKTMLRLALQNPEREIRVVNDQFGSPSWSHTLARQMAVIIETRATGLYHATSEGYCSWYELASRFLSAMDVPFRMVPCTSDEYPTPARRPQNSILENGALKWQGLNVFEDWKMELDRFISEYKDALLNEVRESLSIEAPSRIN